MADRDLFALDARTVDRVAFGEQQPESDHGFRGQATEVVIDTEGRRARATTAAMAITLKDPDREGRLLRIGYRLTGTPTAVAIRVNGTLITTETWTDERGDYDLDYVLPRTSPRPDPSSTSWRSPPRPETRLHR
ncbi:hypothetical protein GCM10029992_49720 [Glycomyces albus]